MELDGPLPAGAERVLTPVHWPWWRSWSGCSGPRVEELLERRRERAAPARPTGSARRSSPPPRHVREAAWEVAPLPPDLLDRRVEITGPTDRKMIINALNSGANVFMADFEDASSPTWRNMVEGQLNLKDAVERTIEYTAPETGKRYRAPATARRC